MDSIIVEESCPLFGKIPIAGAKNACLTLMPATLLSDEPLTLTNAPRLTDIGTMSLLLKSLGVEVECLNGGLVLVLSSHALKTTRADYDIVRKMRAEFSPESFARKIWGSNSFIAWRMRYWSKANGFTYFSFTRAWCRN